MQPWEFGSLPKAWLPALHDVDEIWAYSRSVRDCYLDAGMPPSAFMSYRWALTPRSSGLGLSRWPCSLVRNSGSCLSAGRSFARGSTCCWRRFARAFQPDDGVGLVIKDMGTKSFYRGQTAEAKVGGCASGGIRSNTLIGIWMRGKWRGCMRRVIAWFIRFGARGLRCRSLRRWLAGCR